MEKEFIYFFLQQSAGLVRSPDSYFVPGDTPPLGPKTKKNV